ncbi:hypothetical protein, partial [Actinoplanes philippinensis]|uniref:hypothetical protein n=1 Tax=Actinoplanes philippinensis TaxID=35752 RepID=UPI00340BE1F5
SWLAAAAVAAAATVAVILVARPATSPDPGAPSPADPAQHRVSPGAPISDERLRSAKPMPKGG